MKPIEYYILLHRLDEAAEVNQPFPVTLDQLSEVFFCTRRNVSNILSKLQSEGWIKWVSGNGRKHPSKLTLLKQLDELIKDTVDEYMQEGDIHSVLRFNELLESSSYKDLVLERLSRSIGYTSSKDSNEKKDILRIPFHRSLTFFDPLFIERRAEIHIASQIINTVTEYHRQRKEVTPGLAYRWYSNEDFTKWRFYLKKDIRFHHGKVLTTGDVEFTLNRVKAVKSPYSWLTQDIKRMIPIDDQAIEIHLNRPNKQLPLYLSSVHLAILPSDIYLQDEVIESLPIGTGPFKLAACDQKITRLEVNKDYFRERAFLDLVEFIILSKEALSLLTDLRSHNLQFSPFLYGDDSSSLVQTKMVETGCSYLLFNDHKDVRPDFRKTIKLIIERGKAADNSMIPAYGFLPSLSNGRKMEDLHAALDYSKDDNVQLYTYHNAVNEKNAAWIKEHCEKEGIKVEVNIVPLEELNQPGTLAKADVLLNRNIFREPLDLDIIDFFRNEQSHFRHFFKSELYQRVDREIENLSTSKPEEVLEKIGTDLVNQQNLVFINHIEQKMIHDDTLRNLEIDDLGWINFHSVWFEEEQERDFLAGR
ncbi:ABC transporter substrate-binding protein [Neobacillus niacini]|uniref:ABC transporter substrate-binding protein n=1 Tax=Neobacillus niacini TaxID=86668 RepID=UPI0021CB4936|nr:ABC transporter substrate-binding protein [Neobacillus niacini]MCM3764905.1 ABC transporter substrate-binding protein [Neobacillus niacini]